MTPANVAKAIAVDPLRTLETARPSPAKADLRKPETLREQGQLLRSAIRRADLTLSEASALLGVKDEAQFRRMLDGLEILGVHRLLTDQALPIWDELVALRAKRSGHTVKRVIEYREA